MVITTIKVHSQSAKRREIVLTIKGLTEQLMQSKGCLRAELYQDLDNRNILYILEEWLTIKDMEKYKTSKSLAILLGAEPLLAEPLQIKHAVRVCENNM